MNLNLKRHVEDENSDLPCHFSHQLCLHSGPDVDAELRDTADAGYEVKLLENYVSRHFPRLESKPSIVESCIYTVKTEYW